MWDEHIWGTTGAAIAKPDRQLSGWRCQPVAVVAGGRRIPGVRASRHWHSPTHESHREPSVEFLRPGPSAWTYAQSWAQLAVDRPEGAPLPPYEPTFDPPAPASFVSFALGVALGRFAADGEGLLDVPPATALPSGILFISSEAADSLDHPACAGLLAAWTEHGAVVGEGDDLRTYLRTSFFDYHKSLYENRPIYFPLSSAKKSFVAHVSIHRWARRHAQPAPGRSPPARPSGALRASWRICARHAPRPLERARPRSGSPRCRSSSKSWATFISKVTQLAEAGPPPPDDKTTRREVEARFVMDLDDGVMVNSSALWPLLEPQWKDPKKWWKELANAQGKKDYDWAHLAARYFPKRVRGKCVTDPSLAVAHGCFWELHPEKAYAWELRLQDEIRPDFTLDEAGSDEARARFLKGNGAKAREIEAAERKRRERKAAKAEDEGSAGPLFEGTEEAGGEDEDG